MKTILLCLMLFVCGLGKAQVILIEHFYENQDELLIKSLVIDFDSLSTEAVSEQVKSWLQGRFNDYNEILTGETTAQISLRFLLPYSYNGVMGIYTQDSYYIRMIIQFKQGKARVLIYDGGNRYYPGTHNSPTVAAGTWNFSQFFKDGKVDGTKGVKMNYNRVLAFGSAASLFCKELIDIPNADMRNATINQDW